MTNAQYQEMLQALQKALEDIERLKAANAALQTECLTRAGRISLLEKLLIRTADFVGDIADLAYPESVNQEIAKELLPDLRKAALP